MLAEDLIRMANQIAHFFAVYPDADAVAGVRDHLEKFWDRAMRDELLAIEEEARRRADGDRQVTPGTGSHADASPRSHLPADGDAPAPTPVLEPLVMRALAALRAGHTH